VTSAKDIRRFRLDLRQWYGTHGRDLPWRHTRNPYAILVSEIMLQQTQVATVVPYYHEWFRRFPSFASLAAASEAKVLHAWQGLGYYNRARNLRAAARTIVAQHDGCCPSTVGELRALSGVGRYTANAIATFAFNQPVPIVEANIARLLARLFNIQIPIDSAPGQKALWNSAERLMPKHDTAAFNSALIDLGALVCRPKPCCHICPVKKFCRAPEPALLPNKKARPPLQELIETHGFTTKRDQILLEQSKGRWRQMWILPPLKRRFTSIHLLHTSTFPFTHHRVTLRVFGQSASTVRNRHRRWFRIEMLNSIPIPSPHRRAIVDLLAKGNLFPN
jgi:A/G-specific adenine glycosylase